MFYALEDLSDDYFDEAMSKAIVKRNKFARSNNDIFAATVFSKELTPGEFIVKKCLFTVTSSKATTSEKILTVCDKDRLNTEEILKLVTLCHDFANNYPSEVILLCDRIKAK